MCCWVFQLPQDCLKPLFHCLGGQNRNRFEVIGKAIRAAQNPWRERDEQIEELRQRVSDLEGGEKEVTQNDS